MRGKMKALDIKDKFVAHSAPESSHRRPHPISRWIRSAIVGIDTTIIYATSVASGWIYHELWFDEQGDLAVFFGVGSVIAIYFSVIMGLRRNYEPPKVISFNAQAREITFAWCTSILVMILAVFSLKTTTALSRGATLTFACTGLPLILMWRLWLSRALAAAITAGTFIQRRILVLGEANELGSFRILRLLRHFGYLPVRVFSLPKQDIDETLSCSATNEFVREIISATRNEHIDEIFFAMSWSGGRRIMELVDALRVAPLPIRLLPDQNALRFLGPEFNHVGMPWTVELKRAPLSTLEQANKRALDIIVATTALILLAPLLAIVAVSIKLGSRGPALFSQTRNGFNGRAFRIYKFRTMNVAEDGAVIQQARRNDTRVTKIGTILRQTSIDELPQFLNVLRGDMSVVGPRPHAAAHNTEYEDLIATYAFRYHVKPGITGWAQLQGYRGETATIDLMKKRIDHDLWYINHWSLWLDVKILIKTLFVFARQPSAY
jgi:undecaprenyl-phosphate galactose phosphotransferase/putative colanic acid biosynthesis UDP-glucose lipid carrier transferase